MNLKIDSLHLRTSKLSGNESLPHIQSYQADLNANKSGHGDLHLGKSGQSHDNVENYTFV